MHFLAKKIIIDAHNNGEIAKGLMEVIRSIQKHKAKLVFIAQDLNLTEPKEKIKKLCNKHNVPYITILNKKKLGNLIGLSVAVSAVSINIVGNNIYNFLRFRLYIKENNYLRKIIIDKKLSSRNKTMSMPGWHLPGQLTFLNKKKKKNLSIKKLIWEKKNNRWETTYKFNHFAAKAQSQ